MQTSVPRSHIRNICIAGLFVQAGLTAIWGATYYVSPSGSDSNPGTEAAPFRTIQWPAGGQKPDGSWVVNPGDTVIARDGVYSSNPWRNYAVVVLLRGGDALGPPENPIRWVTFKSENKGGAVLDGQNNTWNYGFIPETLPVSYIRIQDFEIRGFRKTGIHMSPGSGSGSHYEFSGNQIHSIGRSCSDIEEGYSGIFVRNVSSVVIQKNVIHDIGRFAPGEGIPPCTPTTTYYQRLDHGLYVADNVIGLDVINNIFYNNQHGFGIQFYSCDGPRSSGILVANNTFAFPNTWNPGHIILASPGVDNAEIKNNIFYSPTTAGVRISSQSGCAQATFLNVDISYNMVHQGVTWSTPNGQLPSGVAVSNNRENTDPLLLNPNPDPSLFQAQLRSGSPAIDAGATVTEVAGDFDGNPRPHGPAWDIGAYEYYTPGAIDLSFNPGTGPNGQVLARVVQPNGRIVIGGSFTQVNDVTRNNIARLNSDGSLDAGFSTSLNGAVNALALQSDGKIVVGGSFTQVNGQAHNSLVRLNPDGTKDSSFWPEEPPDTVFDVALHPDGKIIAVGYSATWDEALQYGPDGSLYGSIAADSIVRTVAVEATGDILIGGDFHYLTDDFGNMRTRPRIARLRPDGLYIDSDFEPTIDQTVYDIQVQADGKILLAGNFSSVNGIARSRMARLLGDAYGTLDSFAPTPNDTVYSVAYRTDGKVYIGGAFTTVSGTSRNGIARLNAGGTLDAVFDPGAGLQRPPPSIATAQTVGQQADGKVTVGGSFTSYKGTTRNNLVRIHGN